MSQRSGEADPAAGSRSRPANTGSGRSTPRTSADTASCSGAYMRRNASQARGSLQYYGFGGDATRGSPARSRSAFRDDGTASSPRPSRFRRFRFNDSGRQSVNMDPTEAMDAEVATVNSQGETQGLWHADDSDREHVDNGDAGAELHEGDEADRGFADLPPNGFATNGLALRWAKTSKNEDMAIAGGFGYVRNGKSQNGTRIYWICRYFSTLKCYGRITTCGQSVVSVTNEHTHPCDPNLLHVKKALSKISEEAVRSARAPRAVIGVGIADLPDVAYSSMPTPKLLGQKVRRLRAKSAGQPEPADADSVVVPERYRVVDPLGPSPGTQLFVLFDNKPVLPVDANGASQEVDERSCGRVILLATRNGLRRLEDSEIWASDGTFKIRPPQFAQVYGIHGGNGRKMMPCAIALMAKQDRRSYIAMFGALRAAVENTPSLWSFDFEIAVFETVQEKFDCRLGGCFFHFMKCFHKRVQKTGLQQRYADDAQFAANLLQLPALAFVLPDSVDRAFIEIYSSEAYRQDEDLRRFARSWSQVWLGDLGPDGSRTAPRFPIDMWNVRMRVERGLALTNNTVESWHRTAGLVIGRRPTVVNFFHAAQCEMKMVSLQGAAEPHATGAKLSVDAKRA